MSVETNIAAARRFIEDVWNAGNLALVDELMTSDASTHDADPGRTTDRNGYKAFIGGFRAAHPNARFVVEDCFGEGDRVATRVSIHEGEATGWTGIGITRFQDGRITEQWANSDALSDAPIGGLT